MRPLQGLSLPRASPLTVVHSCGRNSPRRPLALALILEMEQLRASLASIDAMRQEGLLSDAEAAELKARELAALRQNSELRAAEQRARQETVELEQRARQETTAMDLSAREKGLELGLDQQRKSLEANLVQQRDMMGALTPALAEAVRTGRCLPAGWRALSLARAPVDDATGGAFLALGVRAEPRVHAAGQLHDTAQHQLAAPLPTTPAPAAAAAAAPGLGPAAQRALPGRTATARAESSSGDAALDAGKHVGSPPSKSLEGSSSVRRRCIHALAAATAARVRLLTRSEPAPGATPCCNSLPRHPVRAYPPARRY